MEGNIRESGSGSYASLELKTITFFPYDSGEFRIENKGQKLLIGLVMTLTTFLFVLTALAVFLATYYTLGVQDA